jgi:hypothetical protein
VVGVVWCYLTVVMTLLFSPPRLARFKYLSSAVSSAIEKSLSSHTFFWGGLD